jgi:sarcosine oxidase subunit gamma
MSTLEFFRPSSLTLCGVKGPRAAEWLSLQGVTIPAAPNTWALAAPGAQHAATGGHSDGALIARLGTSEFFLDDVVGSQTLKRVAAGGRAQDGVYPVLREDAAFVIRGAGVHEVLAQVCNVNFGALALESNPVIMTLMIGVAVLVVPENTPAGRQYRIWCDPTFGSYLEHELVAIVSECGGVRRPA